jgi:hypothetical protein
MLELYCRPSITRKVGEAHDGPRDHVMQRVLITELHLLSFSSDF